MNFLHVRKRIPLRYFQGISAPGRSDYYYGCLYYSCSSKISATPRIQVI